MSRTPTRWLPTAAGLAVLCLFCLGCTSRKSADLADRYELDREGRITQATIDGETTRFRYDRDGQPLETRFRGGSVRYGFDASGRMAWARDDEGVVETFYDAMGRARRVLWSRGRHLVVSYGFDSWNRVVEIRVDDLDATGNQQASAASMKRLAAAPEANSSDRDAREREMERLGAVLDASSHATLYHVRYRYDIGGRLAESQADDGITTFAYRASERVMERRLPGGITTLTRVDDRGRPVGIRHVARDGHLIASYDASYDSDGHLLTYREEGDRGTAEYRLVRDRSGRLERVEAGGETTRYLYDAAGRIASIEGPAGTRSFTYDAAGRLSRAGALTLGRDASGRIVRLSKGGLALAVEYDGRGLPVLVAGPSIRLRYRHDGFGRLVSAAANRDRVEFLPEPQSGEDRPLLAWRPDLTTSQRTFYGVDPHAHDEGAGFRYSLRDVFGAVRATVDGHGRVVDWFAREPSGDERIEAAEALEREVSRLAMTLGRDAQTAAGGFGSNAVPMVLAAGLDLGLGQQPTDLPPAQPPDRPRLLPTDASQLERYLEEARYLDRAGFYSDAGFGLYAEQVAHRFDQFLASTTRSSITVYFTGISNGWRDAIVKTRERCADGSCIYLPTFSAWPNQLQLVPTVLDKVRSVLPVDPFGRGLDFTTLFDAARARGKEINGLVFESGAGFEAQRNTKALVDYAAAHPDLRRPVIVVVSTSIGTRRANDLRRAGFPVEENAEFGMVPLIVRPSEEWSGPLAHVPLVGRTLGFPVQVAATLGVTAGQLALLRNPLDRHGITPRLESIEAVLAAHSGSTIEEAFAARQQERDRGPQLPLPRTRASLDVRDERPTGPRAGSCGSPGKPCAPMPPCPPGAPGCGPPPPGAARPTGLADAPRTPLETLADTWTALERGLGGVELVVRADEFARLGQIKGLSIDARGRLVLVGDGRMTLQGVRPADLALALQLALQPQPLQPRFSLDPADRRNPHGDWLRAVYLPESLRGTDLGRTMFEADWLMKQYSFGVSVNADGRVQKRARMPADLPTLFTLNVDRGRTSPQQEVWTRFWIVVNRCAVEQTPNTVYFSDVRMAVKGRRQVPDPSSPTGLADVETGMTPSAAAFAATLTERYDAVAAESPPFARLKELAKVVALANWLRQHRSLIDADWVNKTAAEREKYVEQVHTLSATQERQSRYVTGNEHITLTDRMHLFGGVDLTLEPEVAGTDARSRDLEQRVRQALQSERIRPSFTFPIADGTARGLVLPASGAGRDLWRVAGLDRDAGGDSTWHVETPTGTTLDVQSRRGLPIEAVESSYRRRVASYRFDAAGRVASAQYGLAIATASRNGEGTIASVRVATPNGEIRAERRGDDVLWHRAGPAGHDLAWRFGADGLPKELTIDGRRECTFSVDAGKRTVSLQADDGAFTFELGEDGRTRRFESRMRTLGGQEIHQTATAEWRADGGYVVRDEAGGILLDIGAESPNVAWTVQQSGLGAEIVPVVNAANAIPRLSTPVTIEAGRQSTRTVRFASAIRIERQVTSGGWLAWLRPRGGATVTIRYSSPHEPSRQPSLAEIAERFEGDAISFATLTEGENGAPGMLSVYAGRRRWTVSARETVDLLGGGDLPELRRWLSEPGRSSRLIVGAQGASSETALRLVEAIGRLSAEGVRPYLATDVGRAAANLARLGPVRGADDVAALVPDASFGVTDRSVVQGLASTLSGAGIAVATGVSVVERGNVLIVTGHKDEALRAYLESAGQAGAFRDKFIVLLSCYAAGDVELNSSLIRRYGALGVHFFPEQIQVDAVAKVLSQSAQLLQAGGPERTVGRLLADAVAAVIRNMRHDIPRLRMEIEKLRRGVSQLSRANPTSPLSVPTPQGA
jgi:YD repeat-containing protein